MTLRAAIFDAAGTLMELRETVGETYSRFAALEGVEISPARLQDAFERYVPTAGVPPQLGDTPEEVSAGERSWWRTVVRGTFRSADGSATFGDFESFFSDLYEFYGSATAWRLRPGVAKGLARLRQSGVHVAVLSNFDHRLPAILDALGILELLETVALPSNTGPAI